MSFITLISSFKTFFFYSIVFFSVVVSAQAQTGLVANWKFDEGTGTSVADDSGNNLTGTFSTAGTGSLTWGSSTAFIGAASALTFEGTNADYAYVNVPDNSTLFNSMHAKMTIEAWIYQSDNADNTIIDRGNYNFLLQANGTGNANPGLKFYNPAIGWKNSKTALPVNEWVHVSMTWDTSSRTLIFYKNGVVTDTFTGLASLRSTAGPLNIGRQDPSSCHCNLMNGKIDELRLWNVVRSQAEISANMNSTLAPVISSFTPTSATTGATVTLTGTNFTGTTAVSFGGTAASSFTVVSSTSITAVAASGTSGSISVTSNNSTATKTGFTYLSSNTDLSTLSISDGTLSPSFASVTAVYAANVSNATTSITVTPTKADVNAAITVNGTPVLSGSASTTIALNIGSNAITTEVTAQNGATKKYTLTVTREMTPPGNALNFDGSNDYVNVGDVIEGFSTITFEAWVNHSTSGNWDEICSKAYVNSFTIRADNRLWFHLGNGAAWFAGGGVASNGTIPSNKWTHVAASWDGTTAKLYINGVLDNTAAHSGTVGSNDSLRGIGGYGSGGSNLFSGKIDELRIYDSVLSQSAIAADMVSTSATSANLIGYYNFDTISGNILRDKSTSNFNGTVINGPTLVESYAMVVPILTAATTVSSTGFTANWTAPAIGTVTNYILDVATDIGFTAPVSGSPFNIAAPSSTKVITGLSPSGTYYYRVRADKTSVTGQGASSNLGTTTTAAVSPNANLEALSISSVALSPLFTPGTIAYTANVSNAITSITVTSTQSDANATILAQVNGGGYATVVSGIASGSLALNEGINTVDVKVTAQDGLTLKTYTMEVTRGEVPTISSFNDHAKYYFDGSYAIVGPTTNSTGALSYSSNNAAVATINGTTVTIVGTGIATVTATQAGDATYNSGSITSVLTVAAVSVLTKNGGISTTNPNYVNKNGGIGKGIALSRNGTILAVKTPPPIAIVGDFRDGGVVFWVDPADNTQGLVCALEDQSTAIKWGTNGIETGAEATFIGSGAANTAAIISVQGGDQSSYVAGISNTYDGGGYKDWFLPSEDEVKEMYLNRVAVNNTLEQRGAVLVGGSIQQYWTSTQSSGNNNLAVGFSFSGGTMSNFNKSDTRPSMRAVRAF
jgi:hypothetical protein